MIVEVTFIRKPTVLEMETGKREEIVLPFVQVASDSAEQAIAIVAVANASKLEAVSSLTPITRKTTT